MKKILFLISACLITSLSLIGGVVYADDSTSSNIDNVNSSSSVSSDNTIKGVTTTSTKHEVRTTKQTTKKTTIGQSSFNITVTNDDMFTGLETLLDAYTTEQYAPQMTSETKAIITKLLTSLVVSVATGDSSYTLQTFKDAFIQILINHGINVTDDVVDAITKYAVHYLDDDLEEDDTDTYLVWIGGTVGMMTTLFITSQMGGVHRAQSI